MIYFYSDTFIGGDYLKKPKFYDTDLLLEFLGGLIAMKKKISSGSTLMNSFSREIEAVKAVLSMQQGI